jgi:tRNA threonylcarbamoyladenosine biosynthesis protein TsaE
LRRYNDPTMSAQQSHPKHDAQDKERFTLRTAGPDETVALGERIGAMLQAGDVLLLQGELGAGKTCLTQGVARGLDIDDQVCSPTFLLVGEYKGRLRLYHADLYRLDDPAEVEELDLARSSEDGVLVVEWPERAPEWLPREHVLIQLEHAGATERVIHLEARGRRGVQLIHNFVPSALTSV